MQSGLKYFQKLSGETEKQGFVMFSAVPFPWTSVAVWSNYGLGWLPKGTPANRFKTEDEEKIDAKPL